MVYRVNTGNFKSSLHPTRVYGDSDLRLAYLQDENERVTARGLVWEDRKLYARLYGNSDVLKKLLEDAGYSYQEGFHGARVRAIPNKGTYLMPYIDWTGEYCELTEDKKWFILGQGDTPCQTTTGLIGRNTIRNCDECNRQYDFDDADWNESDSLCSRCAQYRQSCAKCSESINTNRDEYVSSYNGEYYCESCAESYAENCKVCSGVFYEFTFGTYDQRRRVSTKATMFCGRHWRAYRFCAEHSTAYLTSQICAQCPQPVITVPSAADSDWYCCVECTTQMRRLRAMSAAAAAAR
jgi:hypothetical protein